MSLENVKTLFEIIALALAGAWAIFGFFILKQREKAAADLHKTKLDIEKTELETRKIELELRRIAVVRTEILATFFRRPDGAGFCIVAEVNLMNTGGRDTRIEWDRAISAFSVRRVSFGTDGAPSFPAPPIEMSARQTRDPNATVISTIVRAGAIEHLAFAAHVEYPGIYLLSFRGPVSPQEHRVAVEAGAAKDNPTSWTANRYITITESPQQ